MAGCCPTNVSPCIRTAPPRPSPHWTAWRSLSSAPAAYRRTDATSSDTVTALPRVEAFDPASRRRVQRFARCVAPWIMRSDRARQRSAVAVSELVPRRVLLGAGQRRGEGEECGEQPDRAFVAECQAAGAGQPSRKLSTTQRCGPSLVLLSTPRRGTRKVIGRERRQVRIFRDPQLGSRVHGRRAVGDPIGDLGRKPRC